MVLGEGEQKAQNSDPLASAAGTARRALQRAERARVNPGERGDALQGHAPREHGRGEKEPARGLCASSAARAAGNNRKEKQKSLGEVCNLTTAEAGGENNTLPTVGTA